MSYQDNQAFDSLSGYHTTMAAHAAESERTAFIRRTYMHLTAAVLLFVVLELAIFTLIPEATMQKAIGAMVGGWNWLLVLLAFLFKLEKLTGLVSRPVPVHITVARVVRAVKHFVLQPAFSIYSIVRERFTIGFVSAVVATSFCRRNVWYRI